MSPLLKALILGSSPKRRKNRQNNEENIAGNNDFLQTGKRVTRNYKTLTRARVPCGPRKTARHEPSFPKPLKRISVFVQPQTFEGPQYSPPEIYKPSAGFDREAMGTRRSEEFKSDVAPAGQTAVQYFKASRQPLAARRLINYKIDLPLKLARLLFPQMTKNNTETVIRIYPEPSRPGQQGNGLMVSLARRPLLDRAGLGSRLKMSRRRCMFGSCPGCCPECCSVCCPGGEGQRCTPVSPLPPDRFSYHHSPPTHPFSPFPSPSLPLSAPPP